MQEMQETQVQSLGWEDPLEEEMATYPSILAGKIPWTEEPGGLQSMGSQRVKHDWATEHDTHGTFTSSLTCTLSKSLPGTQQTPPKKGQTKEGQHIMYVESEVSLESKCSSPEWKQRGHFWPEGSQHTGFTGLPGSEWWLEVRWAQEAREAGLVRLLPSCSSAFGSLFPHCWTTDFLPGDSTLIPFFSSADGGWPCVHSHALFLYQEMHTPIYATITDLAQSHLQDCWHCPSPTNEMQTNWCPWRDTWNQSLPNDSLLSAQLLALLGLKSCCFQALGVGALWLHLSIFKKMFVFIWLHWVSVAACRILDPWGLAWSLICGMWDQFPDQR